MAQLILQFQVRSHLLIVENKLGREMLWCEVCNTHTWSDDVTTDPDDVSWGFAGTLVCLTVSYQELHWDDTWVLPDSLLLLRYSCTYTCLYSLHLKHFLCHGGFPSMLLLYLSIYYQVASNSLLTLPTLLHAAQIISHLSFKLWPNHWLDPLFINSNH